MFQKIVLCVDGSEQALNAARVAAHIAREHNAVVELVHVLDPILATGASSMVAEAAISGELAFQEAEEGQKAIMACAGEALEAAGVTYHSYRECGHPVQRIHHVARETQADLIVIGSRGLSAWPALLLGSVSEGVVRHAPCAVLVVRGEYGGTGNSPIARVVIATDGSDCSKQALYKGMDLASTLHAETIVLNVFQEMSRYAEVPLEDMDPEVYAPRVAERVQQQAEAVAKQLGTQYRFQQESGHPVQAIVNFAQREGAELIVVGSRGLGGFQRLLLGSVSTGILHHAHCSVMVVR